MRVDKWHIFGPKSDVSIASLVGRILAVAMEIWNHECPAILAKFRCFCHCMPYWNYHISMGQGIYPGRKGQLL